VDNIDNKSGMLSSGTVRAESPETHSKAGSFTYFAAADNDGVLLHPWVRNDV